mgnify:CR=1 FL=1
MAIPREGEGWFGHARGLLERHHPPRARCTTLNAMPLIRCATDHDGDGLGALIAACFAEYPGCVFDRAAEFAELDAIATHFEQLRGALWVAEQGGAIVGSLGVRPLPSAAVELLKVYVGEPWRGSGLAGRLLEHAVAFACARDAAVLELWSDTRFLRGHRFYEKHGFRRTGESRRLADLSDTVEARFVRPLSGSRGVLKLSPRGATAPRA